MTERRKLSSIFLPRIVGLTKELAMYVCIYIYIPNSFVNPTILGKKIEESFRLSVMCYIYI